RSRDTTKKWRLTDGNADAVAAKIKNMELLRDILTLLRVRTGHDFSNYKRPTLIRRLARHLQVYETDDLEQYLGILREKPEEVLSLLMFEEIPDGALPKVDPPLPVS